MSVPNGGPPFDDFDEFVLRSASGGSLPTYSFEASRRVLLSCGNRQWSFTHGKSTATSPTEHDSGTHAHAHTQLDATALAERFSESGLRHMSWDCGDGRGQLEAPLPSKSHSASSSRSRLSSPGVVTEEDEDAAQLSQAPGAEGAITFSATETQRPRARPPRFSEQHLEHKRQMTFNRVRSFRITSKGVIEDVPGSAKSGQKARSRGKRHPDEKDADEAPRFHRVLVLGATGVGKRALIHEFMVPDHHPFVSTSLGKRYSSGYLAAIGVGLSMHNITANGRGGLPWFFP